MPDRIGRFEVIEKIGEGGMGVVYRARDPQIDRVVAIKLLREGFDNDEMRARFVQEARAAGNLQSPHIVTIFELGEERQYPFIVMEYLTGDPLDKLIRGKAPMPLTRKLELMESLCSGLASAHRAGIVHRDIKPGNLMVMPEGALKILDFGIARAGESERTRVGVQLGTFNYMPPEQMRGEGVDKRSDIFAVGCVFYELLSYQRAFPGSKAEVHARVLTSDPEPLSRICPGLDPSIEPIVVRALSRDPGDRYQDLSEMRREIARVRDRLQRDLSDTIVNTVGPSTDEVEVARTPGSSKARRDESTRRAIKEIDEARQLFDAGRIREALERLEQFAPLNDMVAEALASFRERADDAERMAQRQAAIVRAVEAGRAALQAGDFAGALRAAEEALLIDDRSIDARDIRRRVLAAIDEERRLAREREIAEEERRAALEEERRARQIEAERVRAEAVRREEEARTQREAEKAAKKARQAEAARLEAERRAAAKAAKAAKAAEAGNGAGEESRRRPLLAIAGGALVGLFGLALGYFVTSPPAPADNAPTVQAAPAPAPVPMVANALPVPPAGRGMLVLDALPWAQVVSIVDEDGRAQPVEANAATPFSLALTPGTYAVTLRNGRSQTFKVDVTAANVAQPTPVDFGRIDPVDYFSRLGW